LHPRLFFGFGGGFGGGRVVSAVRAERASADNSSFPEGPRAFSALDFRLGSVDDFGGFEDEGAVSATARSDRFGLADAFASVSPAGLVPRAPWTCASNADFSAFRAFFAARLSSLLIARPSAPASPGTAGASPSARRFFSRRTPSASSRANTFGGAFCAAFAPRRARVAYPAIALGESRAHRPSATPASRRRRVPL
jgi:hypothetical protein